MRACSTHIGKSLAAIRLGSQTCVTPRALLLVCLCCARKSGHQHANVERNRMNSAICTLFEGDYHYGVGALVNSLHRHGYRGIVWAGYRGVLPRWASPVRKTADYLEFDVGDGCMIRFLTAVTERHLTNHKPEFMLDVWHHRCPDAASLFYFDPDIVIKCAWAFFEEWTAYGVAVCEDVNSPMPASHPIRHAWRRSCTQDGVLLPRVLDA